MDVAGTTKNLNVFRLLVVFIFINASLAFAGPNRTTYQAKIMKPDGYPLEASTVNFKFSILSPAGDCILYAETYSSVNMSSTGGLISFALGSGVKTYPVSATTFEQVFSNITPSLSCDVGGPGNYVPLASDSRKVVMQFHDGAGWQTLPAMSINAVPYAMYANESLKLNGKADTDFVQVAAIPTCLSTEALQYNGTSFLCVSTTTVSAAAVVAALGYTPATGASVTALSSSLSTTDATVASVSSAVFSVSSTVSTLASSVAASFTSITSSQWLTSGTAISYDSGNVGIGTTAPVTKLEVSGGVRISMEAATCTVSYAGTLRYNSGLVEYCNGASWSAFGVAGAGITLFNGSSSGTQTFVTGISGTNFNVTTNNGVHSFNIPLAASAAVTAGLLSNADYVTFNAKMNATSAAVISAMGYTPANSSTVATLSSVLNTVSSTVTSLTSDTAASFAAITSSQWVTSGSTINYTAGAVGIGTTNPGALLDLTADLGSGPSLNIYNTNTSDGRSVMHFRNDRVSSQRYEVGIDPGGSTTKNFAVRDLTASGSPVRFAIAPNGRVGLGTASPLAPLDVSGTIRSAITADGNFFTLQRTGNRIHYVQGTGQLLRLNSDSPTTYDFQLDAANGNIFMATGFGNVGIGIASPNARLHLASGSMTVAPLKITSGTLLSAAQAGAVEYDGSYYYITDGANTRRAIATVANPGTYDNASNISSTGNITMTPTGSVIVSSTTASTNSSTGALVVNGGLGVAGAINAAGNIATTANIQGTSITATSGMITPYIYGSTAASGVLTLDSTTNAAKGNIVMNPSGGNVGIGTSVPTTKLAVNGAAGSGHVFTVTNTSASAGYSGSFNLAAPNLANGETLFFNMGKAASTNNRAAVTYVHAADGSASNRISLGFFGNDNILNTLASGNVGVGTSAPTTKLYVSGNGSNAQMTIDYGVGGKFAEFRAGTTGSAIGYDASSAFNIGPVTGHGQASLDSVAMTFNAGNVGVGVTAPSARLHLASGSTTVAPLKFTSGSLLASPASGAVEYDGTYYYITDGANTRRAIATVANPGTYDNASNISSTGNITMTPTGSVIVSSTTASTNSQTGALVVKGGLGVAGNIYSSGTIVTSSNIEGNGIKTKGTTAYLEMHDTNTLYSASPQSALVFRDSGNSQYSFIGPSNGSMIWNSWLPIELDTTGGVDLYVSLNGKVGIGTSSPTSNLDISPVGSIADNTSALKVGGTASAPIAGSYGSSKISLSANYIGYGAGPRAINLYPSTQVDGHGIGLSNGLTELYSNGNFGFFVRPNRADVNGTYASTEVVRMTSTGRMGIGTSAPATQLHIKGTGPYIAFEDSEDPNGSYGTITQFQNGNMFYDADFNNTATPGGHVFRTDGGANTIMTMTSSGHVGIGTTAPEVNLHVNNTTAPHASGTEILRLTAPHLGATIGSGGILKFTNNVATADAAAIKTYTHGANDVSLKFMTGYGSGTLQDRMTIANNGNVGIGTATPAQKLSVVGDVSVTGQVTSKDFFEKSINIADGWAIGDYVEIVQGWPNGAGASSNWEVHVGGTRGNWTEGTTYLITGTHAVGNAWREAPHSSESGYTGGSKCFTVDINGNGNSPQFRIRAVKASVSCGTAGPVLPLNFRIRSLGNNTTWTSLSATGTGATVVGMQPMGLSWNVYTGNPQGNGNLAIHANSAGNVGIGTTAPSEKLEVSGSVKATAYLYTSDERLKKEIITLPDALTKALQLRGVNFVWRNNNEKTVGFIAQEVEAVYPELVKTDKVSGFKAVQYGNIVAILVEALKQEHEERVRSVANVAEKSEVRMNQLEKENQDLKARLEKLEKFFSEKKK